MLHYCICRQAELSWEDVLMRMKVIPCAAAAGVGISVFFAYADAAVCKAAIYFFSGLVILVLGIYIYMAVQHMKLKEFFWRFMPEEDKSVINYIGYLDVPGTLKLGKGRIDFIRKRNEALLKFDRDRAERLIATERKLCLLEWPMFILLLLIGLLAVKTE